ncbi:MAG: Sec-independent protein translocase subunit TatA/TatB [Puniceicoccales bacterium]
MNAFFSNAPVAFIQNLGTPEIVLVVVVILLLFGGKKLPEFARGAGQALREFKAHSKNAEETFKQALNEEEKPTQPTSSQTKTEEKASSESTDKNAVKA